MAAHQRSVIALAEHLLATPLDQLGARAREVIERAVRRHHEPLARAVLPEERRTLGERMAAIGGSWGFIACFELALVSWAALHSWALTRPFDPYPYIFLNLMLSMRAAVQAPIIMMSQNRQAATDRRQARRDFEINLKAEPRFWRCTPSSTSC